MKNVSIALNIVLLIAVAVLYVVYFTGNKTEQKKKDQKQEAPSATEASKKGDNLKIAYVNIDTVLSEYKLYEEMQNMLQEKQKKMQADLQSRSKSFQKEMTQFRKKAQQGLITSTQAKQRQKELTKKQKKLQQLQQKVSGQLSKQRQSMNQQVYDSIQSFLNDYNKDKEYDYIMSNTFSSTLLYGRPDMNLTETVINGINRRYTKAQEQTETE